MLSEYWEFQLLFALLEFNSIYNLELIFVYKIKNEIWVPFHRKWSAASLLVKRTVQKRQ